MRLFTDEQHEYLVSIVKGRTVKEIVEMINKKYDLSIEPRQIRAYKKNHNLVSNLDATFKKGHTPVNKGTKGLYNVGGNKTSFKPGQKAKNWKPVGSERVDRDGYILIKIRDDGIYQERWRPKHKVLWEEANGPLPKGHCLIFLDSNKQNVSLDNLLLITRQQLVRMNQNNLISENPEVTKTGAIIADIFSKMGERKRRN